MPSYDAVVLAGGGGRRLGGLDKAGLLIGGQSLLSRALHAVEGATRRIVVSQTRALPAGVVGVTEQPPGGGPVAGLAAGLAEVNEELVVVLACDMPFVDRHVVERLVAAATTEPTAGDSNGKDVANPPPDGVLLVDDEGRRQPLAAAYRTAPLLGAVACLGTPAGAAMHSVMSELSLVELKAGPHATLDCDTWESVTRSRHLLEDA